MFEVSWDLGGWQLGQFSQIQSEFNSMFLAGLSQNITQEDEWNLRDGRARGRSEILEGECRKQSIFSIFFTSRSKSWTFSHWFPFHCCRSQAIMGRRDWRYTFSMGGETTNGWRALDSSQATASAPRVSRTGTIAKEGAESIDALLGAFPFPRFLAPSPLLFWGCPLLAAAEHLQAGWNLKRIWLRCATQTVLMPNQICPDLHPDHS